MSKQKFAHELVAETAKQMAGAFYEELAKDNEFYKFYPQQKMFINREWKRFIAASKATLAQMLNDPFTPDWQKEQIMDALIKHASLPGNVDRRAAKMMIDGGDVPIINPSNMVH
jgi:hypothetical protein